ncbi:MAG: anhydro-N-acetylmuramic acid kinase [Rhodoferax sp.]|nr:anhydro-N-acetylmuramic acid kinase [Rhodoferax sp.]
MAELFIGLMSGTSLDGVDGVMAEISPGKLTVLAHADTPLPPELRAELLALNTPGPNELHRAALAANALMQVYGAVVAKLLRATATNPADIRGIGAHGQTVRHQPQNHPGLSGVGYTLQLCNPALLAELTGMDVVADFRNRDVAAGGQGAPLVPVFHQSVFGQRGRNTAVLNIGGMANLTVIGPALGADLLGFDCGPGNVLLDAWCQRHTGQPFDKEGRWAEGGSVNAELLAAMRADPYFALPAPKSTGRDLFNPAWLDAHLNKLSKVSAQDVQATLLELTASACCDCITSYAKNSVKLIACGGGAFNLSLMRRLQTLLPGHRVESSGEAGLPPQQVEAAAFAWLARKAIYRESLHLENITGAKGARIAGAVYPA